MLKDSLCGPLLFGGTLWGRSRTLWDASGMRPDARALWERSGMLGDALGHSGTLWEISGGA